MGGLREWRYAMPRATPMATVRCSLMSSSMPRCFDSTLKRLPRCMNSEIMASAGRAVYPMKRSRFGCRSPAGEQGRGHEVERLSVLSHPTICWYGLNTFATHH